MTEIEIVGVLGCGLMGSGIAQACAAAGYRTIVRDTAEPQLAKGKAGIEKSLAKFVEKGKLAAADREAALGRLSFTTDVVALAGCGLIIEAVTEDLALKNQLFQDLDARCPAGTIFASNTSSLSIISMAAQTGRADRFVGLHFFNPVPMMPLVEVVRSVRTSDATFSRAETFVRSLGKDAIRAREHGVASTADLDTAMRLGAGHPMGPLTLADFVGLDTLARIADIMFEEYHETRYAAPPLLRRMVTAGMFGRKSGRGFYDYSQDPAQPVDLGR
jgi:3-hydroxybutyryl-CoA dehydrogenase